MDSQLVLHIQLEFFVNIVGESTQSSLTVLAASVPSKQSRPYWKSSSTTDIQVQWSVPSYNGGSPVIQYRVRRDAGPNTSFLAEVTTTNLFYDFTGLLNSVLTYKVQVAVKKYTRCWRIQRSIWILCCFSTKLSNKFCCCFSINKTNFIDLECSIKHRRLSDIWV